MKSGQEQNKISDILKKLRASYLGDSPKKESAKKATRTETDDELADKLRTALASAEGEQKPSKKTKKTASKKVASAPIPEKSEQIEELVEESIEEGVAEGIEEHAEPAEMPVEESIEGSVGEPVAKPVEEVNPELVEKSTEELAPVVEKPARKRKTPTKKEKSKAPPIEESPVELPPVKEAPIIKEASSAEEPPIEEPIVEEPIVEEPIVEDVIAEESPVSESITSKETETAPAEQKKFEKQGDAIVIRPPAYEPQSPIVISPKGVTRGGDAPQSSKEFSSQVPIRIGGKSNTAMSKQTTTEEKATASSVAKASPPRVVVHPPQESGKMQDTVMTATSSKPLPRPTLGKRRVVKKQETPVEIRKEALPSAEEALEEVLDEVVPEQPTAESAQKAFAEQAATAEPNAAPTPRKQHRKLPERPAKEAPDSTLTLHERITKRSGLDEDDIALVMELGYENELGRIVGSEDLKQLRYEHLRRKSQTHYKHYRTAIGYRGEENVGTHNREKILAAYSHDKKILLIRTVLTSLATLLAVFCEFPTLVGGRLVAYDTAYPYLLPILAILLLGVGVAFSYRQLNAGIRQLLKFAPNPYSVSALLLPLVLLYDIAALFVPASVMLFPANFLALCTLLVTALCDVLRFCCELSAAQLLTSQESKWVLEPAPPRKKKLRQGNKIVKLIHDGTGEAHYRVHPAKECVGFFRRFNSMGDSVRLFAVTLILMLAFSIVLAFSYAVYQRDFFASLSLFMKLVLLCAPIGAVFNYFYPLFLANRLLATRKATLLGEEAVCEYSQKNTVIFDDTDLLVAKIHTQSFLSRGDGFGEDLQIASHLFCKLGGTLGQIATPPKGPLADAPISIVRVTEGGIEAIVNTNTHVLAGDAAFLLRNGIKVPKESTDQALARPKDVSVLYVAINGRIKLRYEIQYAVKGEFESIIERLSYQNTAVAIRTYNPSLNDAFLLALCGEDTDPIHVIHPANHEEKTDAELVDTGAVATQSEEDLVCVLAAANGIHSVHRFGMRMQVISSILAFLASGLLAFLGYGHMLGILAIVLYQAFWTLVGVIASHTELNRSRLYLKK